MPLATYRSKRDFGATPEPAGAEGVGPAAIGRSFVVQKHWASRLHYDFRLEHGGVLWSWAVPKGPSFDPADKPVAIHVEDHPLDYAGFEGTIPKGQYGAGRVIVWDRGTWVHAGDGDPAQALAAGKLVFTLHGEKLAGLWELVRIAKPGDRQEPWILFKKRDAWARPKAEYDVLAALPDSVLVKAEPAPVAAPPATSRRARATPLPDRLAPQLATAVAGPPAGGGWIVETKFDGYRLLARIGPGGSDGVRLFTRNGHDWTSKMPALAADLAALELPGTWLDGEIVVLTAAGVPDFNALQNAVDGGRTASDAIVYFAFDVPYLSGRDLRSQPLEARRAALVAAIEPRTSSRVRLSEAFDAPPVDVLEAARRMGLEGIVVKRREAPYVSARTETWLKVKCVSRQAFVVVGWTERANAPRDVGSLMLATRDPDGTLLYAGNVGTGWNAAQGGALRARLLPLASEVPTVDPKLVAPGRWSKRSAGGEHWVEPRLVVDVSFSDWTPDGHVRHAVWRGFRDDKAADEVVRERPGLGRHPAAAPASVATAVRITNPERVIDATTGLTKQDLFRHYESVAARILPHLAGRPVSLVRAPDGVAGTLFFQKHLESKMPGVTPLDPALWPGHAGLLTVDSVEALLAAAQMNTIEFHTWNSTAAAIDRPDRVVFDLDPGEGVTWPRVQEAAWLVRTLLEELGLAAFLKTSGGKGLHVVAPLVPEAPHDAVKAFARAAVLHLARTVPDRFVAKSGAGNRVGRIFVDWLRMSRGATTAAAFSARARPGLGVSVPIAWEQLASVKSGAEWSIATAREHLSFERVDPWEGYEASRRSIAPGVARLGAAR
jgi:bifunctional non-homologous end joining protein LigD